MFHRRRDAHQGGVFGESSSLQADLRQPVGQFHTVDPTAGRNVGFAADVDVHFTDCRVKSKTHTQRDRQGTLSFLKQRGCDCVRRGWAQMNVGALTLAVQPLPDDAPQQRAAVITEGGRLVIVDVELVWDVDAEALGGGLKEEERQTHSTLYSTYTGEVASQGCSKSIKNPFTHYTFTLKCHSELLYFRFCCVCFTFPRKRNLYPSANFL